ncbi:MAG TPA: Crp/Fnr family transcriptional regulator [Streptosporangiaceae bacterium]|jgi:CRP-like cAMP-binding protein
MAAGAAGGSETVRPGWPSSSLLGQLSSAHRDELLRLGAGALFPERRVIVRQGNADDYVALLTRGLAKVVVDTEVGHEALLAIRASGDLVGEMAALGQMPRSASVVACVPTSVRLIPAETFTAFTKRNPEVLYKAASILSQRLRESDEQRIAVSTLPARERVARVLLEIAHTYGRPYAADAWDLGIPINNSELASLAGAGLSSAEKALRWLQDRGAVGRRKGRVVISDRALLRRLAGRA